MTERDPPATTCEQLRSLEARVTACQQHFDGELTTTQASVDALRQDVHGLRQDVHSMSSSIGSMNTSLETIAATLTKLADLPETWIKVKGFWAVMTWLRENVVLLAVLFGFAGGVMYLLAKASGVLP